jgi:hypothetical protein
MPPLHPDFLALSRISSAFPAGLFQHMDRTEQNKKEANSGICSSEEAAADLALAAEGGSGSIFNSSNQNGGKSKNGRTYDEIADSAEKEEIKAWDGINLRQDVQKKTKMATSIIQGTGEARKPRVGSDFQADIPCFAPPPAESPPPAE